MNEQSKFLIPENDLSWCERNNVKITYPGHSLYPDEFYGLKSKPKVLYYIGTPVWQTHKLISVVGSRSPQVTSLEWLDRVLGETISQVNRAVVSGGARGIDQKAHQVSMRAGCPTMVFLPSGLINMYPHELNEWVKPIVDLGGCVISPFLPSAKMQKHFFSERNILIAAISPITLVVECKRRSGTLLTANYAKNMGKTVAVMPTYPGEAGMGGLDLICDHMALPIRDAVDLSLALGDSAELMQSYSKRNYISHP